MDGPSPQSRIVCFVRHCVSKLARLLWRVLPLSGRQRSVLAGALFRYLPFVFSWTATYQLWKERTARLAAERAKHDEMTRLERMRWQDLRSTTTRLPRYIELSGLGRPEKLRARGIAFYLPQFHPIPENDEWWGTGFTEWTNVRRARPQYEGHTQPARPGELGYYNLVSQPHIRRRQAQLAYQYGLEAFCFYFYWFNGRRLLEAPVEAYADDSNIDFPFCLCWANESWTRTWDGRDDETLITQAHSDDDDLNFISYVARYLRNPKYLKVDGRPVLVVYRPGLLTDPAATAKRWRSWCRKNGIGEIYLVYTMSFDKMTPEDIGFDAATTFPPNNLGLAPQSDIVAPATDKFECKIYDWREIAQSQPAHVPSLETNLLGVTPRWDNTARRMAQATIFIGSDPQRYSEALSSIVERLEDQVKRPQERLVFINAWNEWAEGAYLEPDLDWGYAWLDATRRGLTDERSDHRVEPALLVHDVIEATAPAEPAKIIVIAHDLYPHGAQYLSLNLIAELRSRFGYEIALLACGEGPLQPRFEVHAEVIDIDRSRFSAREVQSRIDDLKARGFERAIINSAASGWVSSFLQRAGIGFIALIHELPDTIERMGIAAGLKAIDAAAEQVVFASEIVRDRTAEKVLGHDWSNSVIMPQGLYKKDGILNLADKAKARRIVQSGLGLSADAEFILGVGYGDHRKGVDTFCHWAVAAVAEYPDLHFVWVGTLSSDMSQTCAGILGRAGVAAKNVHLIGFRESTGIYYAAATQLALTSREDPFPSTVLEALNAGAPAVVIDGAGGIGDLAQTGAITVLPDDRAQSYVGQLRDHLANRDELERMALHGLEVIQSQFGFQSYVGDLLRHLSEPVPKISVVIPNYNYAEYLAHRISSVLNQLMPVWEIVFLDDASSDDSVEVARKLLQNCGVRYRIVRNKTNSGSVFQQWKKGVDLAEGDLVWIAEADDWAARDFLKTATAAFSDPDVVLSYTQSNQVSEDSAVLSASYLDYVADIDPVRWRRPFTTDGAWELAHGLSVKNPIPNVSGAVFRRAAIANVLNEHLAETMRLRVAGDWYVYCQLCRYGKIAYDPRPLNYHRRHSASVTISRFGQAEWDEIQTMQGVVASMTEVPEDKQRAAEAYLVYLRSLLRAVE